VLDGRADGTHRPAHLALGSGRIPRRLGPGRVRRRRLSRRRGRLRRRRRVGGMVSEMARTGTIARAYRHMRHGAHSARRAFPDAALERIEAAIERSEREHHAELRVAIEASLPLRDVFRGRTPRDRALEVFAQTGVWDTEANNGVLLYVLLADHAVE